MPRGLCHISTDRFSVELRLPRDADDSATREVPLLNVSSNSQSSVEVHGSSGNLRQRILRLTFRRPGSRSSGQAARSPGCPQIGVLDFGGDVTDFPSQIFFEEPPSNQTTYSSERSSSGAIHVPTGTRDDTALRNIHQLTPPPSTFSILTASDISSSVFLSEPSSPGAVHVPIGTRDATALRSIHQLTPPTSTSIISTAPDISSSAEASINMSPSSSSLAGFSAPS